MGIENIYLSKVEPSGELGTHDDGEIAPLQGTGRKEFLETLQKRTDRSDQDKVLTTTDLCLDL